MNSDAVCERNKRNRHKPRTDRSLTDDEVRALSPEALLRLLIEAAVREARNRTEDG